MPQFLWYEPAEMGRIDWIDRPGRQTVPPGGDIERGKGRNMEQKQLLAFIQRIIRTSPNEYAAQQALEQLIRALGQEPSAEEMALFTIAKAGMQSSFSVMREQLSEPLQDAAQLRTAAQRAYQQHLKNEAADPDWRR